MSSPAENIQALQYIFDVARQAPVNAVIHEQVKTYAVALAKALTPQQAAAPASLAEAVAAATQPEEPATPAAA